MYNIHILIWKNKYQDKFLSFHFISDCRIQVVDYLAEQQNADKIKEVFS